MGAAPIEGNATWQRTRIDAASWSGTTTTFDDLGRPVEVTDPRGATTTTAYQNVSAAFWYQVPIGTTVTNELGHTTTTELLPQFGVPTEETDANGNLTTYGYDSFGRLAVVRRPTEQPHCCTDESRTWRFFYYVADNKDVAPTVRSRQLTSVATSGTGLTHEDTWVLYDGFLRERQTQSLSPEANKVLVSTTEYDAQGRVRDQMAPEAVTTTASTPGPGSGILNPSGMYQNRTRHSYDALGRTTREAWMQGSAEVHATTYTYGVDTATQLDTVTVAGPEGSQVRETVDGLGRTVEVAEFDGSAWVESHYGYDLADNLTSVNDPEGHQISYGYNMAGWRIWQNDPSRGAGFYGYDEAGNRTFTIDGNLDVVHTIYDLLGRPTQRRADSLTGPMLASWSYDAPDEAGLLNSSTRHTASGTWVSDVTGYDERNRAEGTTLTVPAGVPGLSGSNPVGYTVSQTYDRADRVVTTDYPAVGGLSAETVTTDYNSLGLASSMTGSDEYVRIAGFDDRGRETSRVFGPTYPSGPYGIWMGKFWTYDSNQQLSKVETANAAVPGGWSVVAGHELSYDDAGNITERTTTLTGLGSWRECFGYDTRSRLTDAHTVASASTCASGTPGTGDQPYQASYTYSAGNRLTARVEDGTTTNYGYPASGQPRPYAPVQVGDVTYEWDANGNLTERTEGGTTETFEWDREQRLVSVDSPDGDSSFLYDAEGTRLLRQTADGRTLYFAGHEVTASTDGSQVTAIRSYSFAGELVATRSSAGLRYVITDERGSVEMAAASGGIPTYDRAYEPYGQERADEGSPLGSDRGFLGQIEDESTDLSYLNARYYDTTSGVFISPDPIYDTKQIKSLNPYTYAAANPVALSDPTGLSPSYIHGIEGQNRSLRSQNTELIGIIGRLGNALTEAQGIIRQQQKVINELITRVEALEAIIRHQATIISQLQARVAYLTRVVNYQRYVIGRLQTRVAYQASIIRKQAGVIRYQYRAFNGAKMALPYLSKAEWPDFLKSNIARSWAKLSDPRILFNESPNGGPPASYEAYQDQMGCSVDPESCPGGSYGKDYWDDIGGAIDKVLGGVGAVVTNKTVRVLLNGCAASLALSSPGVLMVEGASGPPGWAVAAGTCILGAVGSWIFQY